MDLVRESHLAPSIYNPLMYTCFSNKYQEDLESVSCDENNETENKEGNNVTEMLLNS